MQIKNISLLFVCGLIVLCLGIFFWKNHNNISPVLLVSEPKKIFETPTPTPMPFEELTIPYLRKRSYMSNLGSLEKINETSSYTSYVTSYQSDGLNINALITKPKGVQPESGFPAIIFIHGYIPPKTYRTTEKYVEYVNYLARNGFVVLKIDLRGHGTSDGQASGAYYSSDYIVDVLNAYAALEQTSFVDKSKIGLWGHSMAGNVVLRSAAVKQTIPAVAIWAGAVYTYTDLREFGIQDASYQPPQNASERQRIREKLNSLYGQPSTDSLFWNQVAATSYLSDLKGAIHIDHAINDSVVNIGYSRNLMKLLDKTQVPHELFEYSSGGHNIEGSSFTQAMQRTVDFYKKYL